MNDTLEVRELLVAISRMPEDRRVCSDAWYESQKEHWIGWLLGYSGPGAYRRLNHDVNDAKTVYNRLACPEMLLYLARGSGVRAALIRDAEAAAAKAGPTQMAKCKAIRGHLPWGLVLRALVKSGYLSVAGERGLGV